jgi:hypothetical protein
LLQVNKALTAEFVLKVSDDEACEIASDLLEEADCPLIEVWDAGQRVYVVAKIASDPPDALAQKEATQGSEAREPLHSG